ncbi:tyrosine phosphatase family-domain-containing protein [Pavlovales sp. CCMP2436]|nr:tyrosine phosphatase family-domain-containing protein [Pavlovales sp. CCMP2436]
MAEPMIPPINFELVAPGVYRSGFPTRKNLRFLRGLGLRSVIRLSSKEYSPEVVEFMAASEVAAIDCITEGNREPFSCINARVIRRAFATLTATHAKPVLVHCVNGQQTTGCIIGLLRRTEGWALSAIFDEYRRHVTGGKVHALDLQMIELWPVDELLSGDAEDEEEAAEAAAPAQLDAPLYDEGSQQPSSEQEDSGSPGAHGHGKAKVGIVLPPVRSAASWESGMLLEGDNRPDLASAMGVEDENLEGDLLDDA